MNKIKATTIIAVKKGNKVAMAGDGQVTLGDVIVKNSAKKIRKIDTYNVLMGFAGTAADAFALMEKFEMKLEEFQGNLKKASVELAKEWRNDKALRMLEAMLIVADKTSLLVVSGTGDVIENEDGIAVIGSGGNYAYAAAKGMLKHTELSPEKIAVEAMKIAGEMCIYTNSNISVETI